MSETTNGVLGGSPTAADEFRAQFDRDVEWLRRKCGNGVHATSAIAEVRLRILQRQKAGIETPPGGFWRAVMWRVRDQFRRVNRHKRFVDRRGAEYAPKGGRVATEPMPDEEAMHDEARGAIGEAVRKLSPDDQELWARLQNGETAKEIAAATGRSLCAVKMAASRLPHRIMKLLPPGLQPDACPEATGEETPRE